MEKNRHTVWLPEDIWQEVESAYKEDNCANHLLAEDADMDAEMYRKYRGYSVREVTDTQGAFSFRDALRLHRKW